MDAWRWVLAVLVAAAIVALIAFARGTPEHGGPTAPPVASPAAIVETLTL